MTDNLWLALMATMLLLFAYAVARITRELPKADEYDPDIFEGEYSIRELMADKQELPTLKPLRKPVLKPLREPKLKPTEKP